MGFDDSKWQVVCAPHTLRLEPSEASGGRNYQGIAWYRKHFTMPADMQGKDVTLYFEAIMGKQKIYVNGRKAVDHLGGYLPTTAMTRAIRQERSSRHSTSATTAVCTATYGSSENHQ